MLNKSLACSSTETKVDLGVHNKSYECQSHADLGSTNGRNYGGANVALWRGDTDKHCVLCKLSGPQSGWSIKDQPGSVIFALTGDDDVPTLQPDKPKEDGDGEYAKGRAAAERRSKLKFESHVRKTRQLELGIEPAAASVTMAASMGMGIGGGRAESRSEGGNPQWILKSNSFGGPVPGMDIGSSWTWLPVPEFLQGFGALTVDPTNSSTLYAVKGSCIARSYDGAESWEECWKAPGLEGNIGELIIKDSQTMLAMRSSAVPLRTTDGAPH
jgi:hypothetical protein